MKNEILFVYGRTPRLAHEELASFFPDVHTISDTIALVKSPISDIRIHSLGGTVKIVRVIQYSDVFTPDIASSVLREYAYSGRLTFGISVYGKNGVSSSFFQAVKTQLTHALIQTRFVEPKQGAILSSVAVEKHHVTELVAVFVKSNWIIGVTQEVQPFEEWSTRDYGRPASDPHRGMLPPKVSRMIVNIALANYRKKTHTGFPTLLDPFCGVGTVLVEALLSGAVPIGCDISKQAVQKAEKNLAWAAAQYGLIQTSGYRVFVQDATHIGSVLEPESIDAIATEPFLGEPVSMAKGDAFSEHTAKNILKGLEKLYTGSLKSWKKILVPNGRVVMAMPVYMTKRGEMRVKNIVDRCENLGYTLCIGPIEYSRPQATVKREFVVFEKT